MQTTQTRPDAPVASQWTDAAHAGLYLGMALVAFALICWAFRLEANAPWVVSLGSYLLLAFFSYAFTRKRSLAFGPAGFSYVQGISFILSMMLFAGIIYGAGTYVIQNYLDPDYYRRIMDRALETMVSEWGSTGSGIVQEGAENARKLLANPIFMIFNGIFYTLIFGGMMGLFVSIFAKRPPKTTNNQSDGEK